MAHQDIDRVVEIEQQSFPTSWRRDAYERELLNANARYLVAKIGVAIVAYGGMWAIADEAHITTLAVDPEHRGRGIGERLLVALLEAAQDMGATRVVLEVRESNAIARALYGKYGFEAVAHMRGYYPDTGEDALVMWLNPLRLAAPAAAKGDADEGER